MTFPSFTGGEVLNASDMNAVGLWLVKTQSVGTAVSSVTVSDAFSSTYDNYLVTLAGGTGSADAAIGMHLGSSTVSYFGFLTFGNIASGTVLGANINNSSLFNYLGGVTSGQHAHVSVIVMGPNLARYTKFVNAAYSNGNNFGTAAGEHRVATAFTAFTITPSSGTLTGGTIRVYGYRN